jgi:L-ascorbate metabolism protein UlaG (beta-lactamase superfamily)
MGATDTIKAAELCGAKKVVGVHYNTFPPIQIDTIAAQAAFANEGLELQLPAIGSTIEI